MIGQFLRDKVSWIGMFVLLSLLLLLVAYVDTTIPFNSILYILLLFWLLLVVFLFIRYHRETRYYRGLKDWEKSLDASTLPEPDRTYEYIIHDSLQEQVNFLNKTSTDRQESLEREKDELLSWIHEVKTPLTAMQLIIERIEDAALKQQLTYEWLRVHMLLDTQIHQKRITFIENDLFIEKIDLHAVISQEIRTLRSWCMQKGIGFDLDLEEDVVLSDTKWLTFILRQLLSNAVKYSENSDIHIGSEKINGHVRISIQDQGIGIDAKDLPRIFDQGFTSTIQHDKAATGMGLYLTKKAAKPLRIKVDVSSHLGKGTCFTLTFPKRNDMVGMTGV
ncbi:two-component system, OmpR family, bacitracin resistance sensor histidine kinase BceS [Terribacillus halophilus]|uniref:histidine kinase n=1 Tax=Terribacillus halophilus TaxID=361279 RepID=A0A1G6LLT2_9BACI|nr:sensor histidine kinase [Terribacillus halophilus]SDC44210.1 two-component system, OmpR family, bacitracin resistance sensor histidine kinase BceS [Terribacillus halophilus]